MRPGNLFLALGLILIPTAAIAASPDCDKVKAGAWNGTHPFNNYVVKPPGAALDLGLGRFSFAADETISISLQMDRAGTVITTINLSIPWVAPSTFSFFEGPYNPLEVALGVEQEPVRLASSTTDTINLVATFRVGEPGGVPAGRDVYPVMQIFKIKEFFDVPDGQLAVAGYHIPTSAKISVTATCAGAAAQAVVPPPVPPTVSAADPVRGPEGNVVLLPLTELTVRTNNRSVRVGKPFTTTVRVVPATASGTVDFLEAGQPLCAGVRLVRGAALCQSSFATAGVREITVRYSGDNSFAEKTSGPANIKVVGKR